MTSPSIPAHTFPSCAALLLAASLLAIGTRPSHAQAPAPAATPDAAAPQSAAPTSRKQAAAQWTDDGLQATKIRGLDVVYARPDSSLAGYTSYRLAPVSVAFIKHWGRGTSMRPRVSDRDMQKIRDRLATLVREELTRELGAGGYTLSEEPGEGVLDLELRIVDLNVVAPDVASAAGQRVYAVSAGEMTLVAELRDSSSGQAVMRIYDHESGDDSTRMRRITNMENEIQARDVVGGWAKALRQLLDAARAAP